jgi:hypothetical protein
MLIGMGQRCGLRRKQQERQQGIGDKMRLLMKSNHCETLTLFPYRC